MRKFLLAAALIGAGSLAGCETLNEDQCRAQDWLGIGQRDGLDGQPISRIEAHAKACSKFAVLPDPVAYERGREAGLRLFCTPPRGYRHGVAGNSYQGVCPPETEEAFLRAYSDGRLVHAAEADASRAASAAASARSEARDAERKAAAADARAADPKLTDDERERARREARDWRRERQRWLDESFRGEREERDARSEADRLRARFSAYYGDA